MAVNNRLVPANEVQLDARTVKYLDANGVEITLGPNTIRQYLVSGGGQVTDQEVVYFLNLCKFQRLNPFIKECYLVKYGSSQPAAAVIAIGALLKRARRNTLYAGHQAGVIVRKGNELDYRVGSLVLDDEVLVGGWAKVYIKGDEVPAESSVSFKEYVGTKSDGRPNQMWAGKPGTMIRKVALATALREAFPEDLSGMYAPEEVGASETPSDLPPEIPQPDAMLPDQDPEPLPWDDPQPSQPIDDLPGDF